MTIDDFDAFSAVVVGFAELRGKQLSPEAIELYFRSMSSWSLSDFKAAAEQLLRTSQFMPTPYDFEQLRKAARPTAAEAWIEARATARGWREVAPKPSSGDALTDLVVESIGGYRAIAMCQLDRMSFLEKRFSENYETLEDAEDARAAVPQLMDGTTRARLHGPTSAGSGLRLISADDDE